MNVPPSYVSIPCTRDWRYCLFFVFLFISNFVGAQEVFSVQGNDDQGNGLQLSWTIGEPIIETTTHGKLTLTQGFHQPYMTVERVEHTDFLELSVEVYPNPTIGRVNIQVIQENPDLTLEILDATGRRKLISKYKQNQLDIDVSRFASGLYLLSLYDKNSNKKAVFKLEKI